MVPGELVSCCDKPNCVALEPLVKFGRAWVQPREELDHHERKLIGSSDASLEDQLTNPTAPVGKEGAWEVSVGHEDMVGNWSGGYSW